MTGQGAWALYPVAQALVAGLWSLSAMGCERPPPRQSVVDVFIDMTEIEELGGDASHLQENLDAIIGMVSGEDHPLDYGTITLFPIYDFASSTPKIASIGQGSRNGNRLNRLDEIATFRSEVEGGIQDLLSQFADFKISGVGSTYRESYIVEPVCRRLERVVDPDADWHVIVFSDMLEKSAILSFYDESMSDEEVLEVLEGNCLVDRPLPRVCLQVVYQPLKANDRRVLRARRIWEGFLGGRAAESGGCLRFDTFLGVGWGGGWGSSIVSRADARPVWAFDEGESCA